VHFYALSVYQQDVKPVSKFARYSSPGRVGALAPPHSIGLPLWFYGESNIRCKNKKLRPEWEKL